MPLPSGSRYFSVPQDCGGGRDTPDDNLRALVATAREYGRY